MIRRQAFRVSLALFVSSLWRHNQPRNALWGPAIVTAIWVREKRYIAS